VGLEDVDFIHDDADEQQDEDEGGSPHELVFLVYFKRGKG
jgi:hypothetical protein